MHSATQIVYGTVHKVYRTVHKVYRTVHRVYRTFQIVHRTAHNFHCTSPIPSYTPLFFYHAFLKINVIYYKLLFLCTISFKHPPFIHQLNKKVMETPKYHCTQQELYTIATLGWNSCQQHLSAFTMFKTTYTASLITDKLAEVTAAMEIPDEYQRTEESKLNHIALAKSAADACTLYQKLKRYILASFPANQQAVKLDSAGQQYYSQAASNNWEAAQAMLTNASAFISANATILQANGGMPATFGTIVTTEKDNFTIIHQTFLDNEESQRVATAQKVTANNNLYTSLITMFLDGQEIFKTNEEVRSQFIFEHCLYLVRGAGTAGIRGHVSDSSTTLPISDATIQVGINDYTGTTDSDGFYQISPAAAGTYTITATATGYQPFTTSFQILTGTISTLNILLIPQP
jgi:hypothetical protein